MIDLANLIYILRNLRQQKIIHNENHDADYENITI